MKKLLIVLLLCSAGLQAQVKIGDNPNTIGTGSLLELESTNKGLVITRVANTAAVTAPVNGMIIYDLSFNCFKGYQNGAWSDCGFAPNAIAITSGGTALVSGYTCSTASTGTMTAGTPVTSVTQTITATVTTVGTYSISTTANGVTFAAAGTFAGTGTQNIVLTATGTPTAVGSNSFTLNTTPNCSFNRTTTGVPTCAVLVAPGVTKEFLCHNLGADTSLDPHTPVVGLQGAYIQWGRRGPNTTGDSRVDWQTAGNTANFAAAPTSGNANAAAISGWSTSVAPNGSWGATKTINDPCPAGYRVPTSAEWTGVNANNTASRTGTFANSNTEYGSALHYGPNASTKLLTLPAAGLRSNLNGTLSSRGSLGSFWCSTENGAVAFNLLFGSSSVTPASYNNRTFGFSLRCIAE